MREIGKFVTLLPDGRLFVPMVTVVENEGLQQILDSMPNYWHRVGFTLVGYVGPAA